MVKYVLFSLSLLSTLIGLGDCELKSGECEFSTPDRLGFASVDLSCNEDTVGTIRRCLNCKDLDVFSKNPDCKYQYKRYEGCNGDVCKGVFLNGCPHIKGCRRTVEFDLSRSGDSIKAAVSCLEEYKGVDFIIKQSNDPVYDVLQFVHDKVNYTLVISSKPVSDKDTNVGLWISDKSDKLEKDRGLLNIHCYVGSDCKMSSINSFKFEPKKYPRNQATLVMLHETGSIFAKPVESAFAQQKSFEAKKEKKEKKDTFWKDPILWAMVLSEDQGRLFKAAGPDDRNLFQFEYVDEFNFPITSERKGSQPADDHSPRSRKSTSPRKSRRASPYRRT